MKFMTLIFSLFCMTTAYAHDGHHDPGMSHLVFARGALHAHAKWIVGPQVSQVSLLRIEWMNGKTHTPTEPPGPFTVSLWMPDMDHGSAPTQLRRVLNPQGQVLTGVFDVYNVYFMMGGNWQVLIKLNYADGSSETKMITLHLQGGGHGPHH